MRKLLLAALLASVAGPALAAKAEGIIPGLLVGPKIGILSLPTPTVGLEAQLGRWAGLSFDYGLVPDLRVKSATASWRNWYLGARVFPFRGSFFLGALYGRRTFEVSLRDDAGLEGSARISSSYVAPELGWRWIRDSGFTLGVDLGWQLALDHSTRLTIPGGFEAGKQQDVEDAARKLGTTGLPVLGLLQLGWMF